MWNIAVLVVLMAAAGIYGTRNLQTMNVTQGHVANAVAADMALYRDAVVRYFSATSQLNASVSFATLKSTGMLPSWSTLYQSGSTPAWNNYRDANGIIYVYADALPTDNILAELTRLSHNSMLVGTYRTGSATLQSPVFGDTLIPVTALNGKSIPDGAPVWIAMTQ